MRSKKLHNVFCFNKLDEYIRSFNINHRYFAENICGISTNTLSSLLNGYDINLSTIAPILKALDKKDRTKRHTIDDVCERRF